MEGHKLVTEGTQIGDGGTQTDAEGIHAGDGRDTQTGGRKVQN